MKSASLAMLLFLAGICVSPVTGSFGGSKSAIVVDAAPTGFARLSLGLETFGKLEFRGGLVLSSPDPRFGGFSGLALSASGDALMAVSDDGWWFKADVDYENGRPSALTEATLEPLLDREGRRSTSKQRRDAEALALDPPGQMGASAFVGFEMRPRIEKFDLRAKGLAARPVPVPSPAGLRNGPYNGQLEALGKLTQGPWKGALIALSERNLDSRGNIRGWIIDGKKGRTFSLARHEDYAITDLAVLRDGTIVTLERSFGGSVLPGMALRRFSLNDLKNGATIMPEILFSGRQPFYLIDNMEGIAAHQWRNEERITVISDDNYNRGVQRTVMFQFALSP